MKLLSLIFCLICGDAFAVNRHSVWQPWQTPGSTFVLLENATPAAWNNCVPNSFNATQTTNGSQPVISNNVAGAYQATYFGVTPQFYLFCTNTALFDTTATNCVITFVARGFGATPFNSFFLDGQSGGNDFWFSQWALTCFWRSGAANPADQVSKAVTATFATNWYVITYVRSGTNGAQYTNGVLMANAVVSGIPAGGASGLLRFGQNVGSGSYSGLEILSGYASTNAAAMTPQFITNAHRFLSRRYGTNLPKMP